MNDQRIPIVSVDMMRASDAYTIEHLIGDARLMERAGRGIAVLSQAEGSVAVICGPGNNGGDGYVAARFLANAGLDVTVFFTKEPTSEASIYHRGLLDDTTAEIIPFDQSCSLESFDTILDCLLGTGFTGCPHGLVAESIKAINHARATGSRVVSADINSGMNADTGEAELAVTSDLTVSVGFLKIGMLTPVMQGHAGHVVTIDIGIELSGEPDQLISQSELPSWIDGRTFFVDEQGVHRDIPAD